MITRVRDSGLAATAAALLALGAWQGSAPAGAVTTAAVATATVAQHGAVSKVAVRRAPALLFATARSVRLRLASGTVRTLATFATSPLPPRLAFSPDGIWVAWLIDFQRIGLAKVTGGPVRTWTCTCGNIGFAGDTLMSDSFSGKPHLLRYPAGGGAPARVPVTGLPRGGLLPKVFDLLAGTPAGRLIAGYGTGVAAYGGPQFLYRVSPAGRATLFAPRARQRTANTAPWDFAFSSGGTRMAFVLTGHGGFCADSDAIVLATVASGAESVPARARGQWYAGAAWYGPSGIPQASMIRVPSPCGPSTRKVIAPGDYRDARGRWVRTGTGTLDAAYAPGGWKAVLTGKVIATGVGISGYSGTRLTVSHGASKHAITGVTAFALLP